MLNIVEGVSWGPPTGEGWQKQVQWWRPFACECGYMGMEYWNEGRDSTLVCTKCGNGRVAITEEGSLKDDLDIARSELEHERRCANSYSERLIAAQDDLEHVREERRHAVNALETMLERRDAALREIGHLLPEVGGGAYDMKLMTAVKIARRALVGGGNDE